MKKATNRRARARVHCTDDRATFDWAEFGCEAARLGFELDMRVEQPRYQPLTEGDSASGGAPESHTLAMPSTDVDGVRLTVGPGAERRARGFHPH